jgi:hypothetical protein
VFLPGGAYDLEGLAEHLHRRGLYKDLLDTVMTLDGRVSTPQHTTAAATGLYTGTPPTTTQAGLYVIEWLAIPQEEMDCRCGGEC